MIFDLQPGRGLLPVELGMSVAALTAMLGDGTRRAQFGSPDESLFFAAADLRVTLRDERVIEISVTPPSDIHVDGVSIWHGAKTWRALVAREPSPVLAVGFVILPTLGVAFTGLHDGDRSQRAVTVFAEGVWDASMDDAEPFTA